MVLVGWRSQAVLLQWELKIIQELVLRAVADQFQRMLLSRLVQETVSGTGSESCGVQACSLKDTNGIRSQWSSSLLHPSCGA